MASLCFLNKRACEYLQFLYPCRTDIKTRKSGEISLGTVSFNHYERLKTVIENITSVRHGNIYAEVEMLWVILGRPNMWSFGQEFATKFASAIKFNQELKMCFIDQNVGVKVVPDGFHGLALNK